MPEIHICSPQTVVRLIYINCPTCKTKRAATLWDTGFSYWSSELICWGCGENWGDGEMLERPFRPRWRKENKERARCDYKERGINKKEAMIWIKKSMEEFMNA